jgi:hypothetical protein
MKISKIAICVCFTILLYACSTKVVITDRQKLSGKKIAIGQINLTAFRNNSSIQADTLCECVANSIAEHMNPFFLESGMTVIDIPVNRRYLSREKVRKTIDSVGLDYILIGTGNVHIIGRKPSNQSYFMHNLTMKLIGKNLELVATGEFSGWGVYPDGAAKRIGKKFLSTIRKELSK